MSGGRERALADFRKDYNDYWAGRPGGEVAGSVGNGQIAEAFREIYNGFWLRHRDHANGMREFDRIFEEAFGLFHRYPFQLARSLLLNFLDELAVRAAEREADDGGRRGRP